MNILLNVFKLLQNNGYDVRLGDQFYVYSDPNIPSKLRGEGVKYPYLPGSDIFIFNPHDPENVADACEGPQWASEAKMMFDMFQIHMQKAPDEDREEWEKMRFLENISPKDKFIMVTPWTMYLCHTIEFVGGRNVVTTKTVAPRGLKRKVFELLKSNDFVVALEEFFIGPGESCLSGGELMTEILLDKPASNVRAIFMKKGRVKMDLAIASVGVLLEMDGDTCKKARFAAGSVAPVPLRLKRAEELFENAVMSKEIIREAQEIAMNSISPITDIRSTAEYRREIVGVYR